MIQSRNQIIGMTVLLLAILAALLSCGEEGSDSTGPTLGPGGNRPVGIPTAANDVSLSPTLFWHAIGGVSDSVVYDFYLGTSSTPSATQTNLADTSFATGPLLPGVGYYWAVLARINGSSTGWSDVYSFGSRTGITYPVTIGNRWEYRRELTALSTQHGYFLIEILGTDTGWQVEPVYEFEETWFDLDQVTLSSTTTWYHVNSDGFYLAGYDGPGNIIPASTSGSYRFIFGGREFGSIAVLLGHVEGTGTALSRSPEDIIVENPPKLGLKYPIALGSEWTFRESDPWPIFKHIHDYEIISVPAGEFGCFVVRWLEDTDNDGTFNENLVFRDYIAKQGLVRRSIIMSNVLVIDEFGNEIDFIDIIDEYELVAWE